MFTVLALFVQAALPPSGLHYFARTDYAGPGLICGAAFSVRLRAGESAVLTKNNPTDAKMGLSTRDGPFSVYESQYRKEGGTIIARIADGVLRRKRQDGQYIWIYRDRAPGSTNVSGPAVNFRKVSPALKRILFGGPHNGFVGTEKCIEGRGSDRKTS